MPIRATSIMAVCSYGPEIAGQAHWGGSVTAKLFEKTSRFSRLESHFIFKVGLLLLSAAISIYAMSAIVAFHSNNGMSFISGDSLQEFYWWQNGKSGLEKIRHNGAAAWLQALTLWLDIYIGPYALWSYLAGYLLCLTLIPAFWVVCDRRISPAVFWFLIAVCLLIWVGDYNRPQVLDYHWRIVEVGCQIATLAGGMLAMHAILKHNHVLLGASLFGAFIASHTHGGYAYFHILLVFLALQDTRPKARLGWIGAILVYAIYMYAIEGTYADLVARLLSGDDGSSSLVDVVLAAIFLYSVIVVNLLEQIFGFANSPWLRLLFYVPLAGLSAVAIYRFLLKKDPVAGSFLLFQATGFAFVLLAAIARFERYGFSLVDIPRYSSYSTLALIAMLWYGASLARPLISTVVLAGFAVLLFPTIQFTKQEIDSVVKYGLNRQAQYYSSALNPEDSEAIHGLPEAERRSLLNILPILDDENVAGFDQVWDAVKSGSFNQLAANLPECGGRLQAPDEKDQNDELYDVWVYWPELDGPERHFLVAFNASQQPIALAHGHAINARNFNRAFVPETPEPPLFALGSVIDGSPRLLCKVKPND